MKKRLLFLLLIIIPIKCFTMDNPYSEMGLYGTNCTWYAWKMSKEIGGGELMAFSENVKDWYNSAASLGYSMGITLKANSIVVWGNMTEYGHVGYVERVDGKVACEKDALATGY